MKRLTIKYGEHTFFDAEVSSFTWSESDSAIAVKGTLGNAKNPLVELLGKRSQNVINGEIVG